MSDRITLKLGVPFAVEGMKGLFIVKKRNPYPRPASKAHPKGTLYTEALTIVKWDDGSGTSATRSKIVVTPSEVRAVRAIAVQKGLDPVEVAKMLRKAQRDNERAQKAKEEKKTTD